MEIQENESRGSSILFLFAIQSFGKVCKTLVNPGARRANSAVYQHVDRVSRHQGRIINRHRPKQHIAALEGGGFGVGQVTYLYKVLGLAKPSGNKLRGGFRCCGIDNGAVFMARKKIDREFARATRARLVCKLCACECGDGCSQRIVATGRTVKMKRTFAGI